MTRYSLLLILWVYGAATQAFSPDSVELRFFNKQIPEATRVKDLADVNWSNTNETKRSVSLLEKAIPMALRLKDTMSALKCYSGLASISQRKNRFKQAEGYILRGRKLASSISDKSVYFHFCNKLIDVYINTFELNKAQQLVRKCLEDKNIKNYPKHRVQISITRGSVYLGNQNFETGKGHARTALELAEEYNIKYGNAFDLVNKAELLLAIFCGKLFWRRGNFFARGRGQRGVFSRFWPGRWTSSK